MSSLSDYRKLRIILIYDLPSVAKDDQKYYRVFNKDIRKLGFFMLQYSVYVKVLTNDSEYNRIISKVSKIIPKKGNIIIIKITEKQYNNMIYLIGTKNKFDMIIGSKNIVYFGGDGDD